MYENKTLLLTAVHLNMSNSMSTLLRFSSYVSFLTNCLHATASNCSDNEPALGDSGTRTVSREVRVNAVSGEQFDITVPSDATVEDLKRGIYLRINCPPELQNLTVDGNVITDTLLIHTSVVEMSFKLAGGGVSRHGSGGLKARGQQSQERKRGCKPKLQLATGRGAWRWHCVCCDLRYIDPPHECGNWAGGHWVCFEWAFGPEDMSDFQAGPFTITNCTIM